MSIIIPEDSSGSMTPEESAAALSKLKTLTAVALAVGLDTPNVLRFEDHPMVKLGYKQRYRPGGRCISAEKTKHRKKIADKSRRNNRRKG